ncbi:MAG: hypothetical protein NW215_00705 [Hyphomicrobiales bacterium]|nr:hypothetical protein [Hyphomicrobiales bacterium]
MVSEIRKQQLRDSARVQLERRWGSTRPEALQALIEELRVQVAEERLLGRTEAAIDLIRQRLADSVGFGAERQAPRERNAAEQEFDAGR